MEVIFNDPAKGIKDNHIDKKMYPSGMKETIGKKPVPMIAVFYIISIKFKPVEELNVVKS